MVTQDWVNKKTEKAERIANRISRYATYARAYTGLGAIAGAGILGYNLGADYGGIAPGVTVALSFMLGTGMIMDLLDDKGLKGPTKLEEIAENLESRVRKIRQQ